MLREETGGAGQRLEAIAQRPNSVDGTGDRASRASARGRPELAQGPLRADRPIAHDFVGNRDRAAGPRVLHLKPSGAQPLTAKAVAAQVQGHLALNAPSSTEDPRPVS